MTRRRAIRRVALVASAAVAAAAVVVAVLALTRGSEPAEHVVPPGRDLFVSATLSPRVHLFGDTVRARISVTLDRRRLDPAAVRVAARFSPYEMLEPLVVTRRDVGDVTELTYSARLRCLSFACAPEPGESRRLEFPPARLTYGDGEDERIAWPEIVERSWLDPVGSGEDADPSQRPLWAIDVQSLPPVSYAVSPRFAFWGVLAAAALLVAVAVLLLRPRIPARLAEAVRRRRAPGSLPPLEHALAAVETACERGGFAERRKALELLSGELVRAGQTELAFSARRLAWSQNAPASDTGATFAGEVRRSLAGTSDGRRV